MKSRDTWNKCDCCGKFISYADFASDEALRFLITPDAEGTRETFETLCKNCK